MNGTSTFLSLPRLSKTRKRFALGYLLFILLLITPLYPAPCPAFHPRSAEIHLAIPRGSDPTSFKIKNSKSKIQISSSSPIFLWVMLQERGLPPRLRARFSSSWRGLGAPFRR